MALSRLRVRGLTTPYTRGQEQDATFWLIMFSLVLSDKLFPDSPLTFVKMRL